METMTSPNDPRKHLAALMDACAENAESMTDEELLEEAAATGVDASVESSRIRGVLFSALVNAKKAQLADAAREYQKGNAVLTRRAPRIPFAAPERRAFLIQELERRPHVKDAVTELRHGDVPSFSDADVESVLKQLEALGLLADGNSKPES